MSQQEILRSAYQGDPKAIAILLNQALKPKQVQAHLTLEYNHLYISLESPTIPDQAASVRVIHKGLMRLEPPSIWCVTIAAQLGDDQHPAWIETLVLKSPPVVVNQVSPKNAPVSDPKPPQKTKRSPLPKNQKKTQTSAPPKTKKKTKKVATASPVVSQMATSEIAPNSASSATTKTQRVKVGRLKSLSLVGYMTLAILPLSGLIVGAKWDRVSASLATIPPTLATASQAVLEQLPQLPNFSFGSNSENPPMEVDPLLTQATIEQIRNISELTISSLRNPIDPDMRITIKSVGDIIPGSNYPYNKLHPNKQVLFAGVKPALQDADIVFGNFESTLTNYPNSAKNVGRGMVFAFRTPPEYAALLREAGFDILSVANNHSFDFFETGFKDTIANIEKAGMKAVGKKGQIVYHEVRGVNVAFIGFSYFNYHNNMNDLEASQALIKEAAENADIVVVSVHAGAEGTRALRIQNRTEYFYGENRGNKVLFARTMIDAGADLVLGHGPHVPRALELYNGKLIAYSLGNFLGYRTLSTRAELGYSLVLETQLDVMGNFVEGRIIPVHLDGQGIPSLDNSLRTVGLMRRLTKSDFPDTPLEIDDQGNIFVSQPQPETSTAIAPE
ncbi:CapA family protein [Limnospira platensis]|uniref:CapA family protein n=1 Tax=Limnospira platensis TaxID=118562 RepID=UPI0002803D60|nr:putative enzyme of poly-gamma-glutamate biosynthesis [Arthrospira platensis C1]UWU48103.1 Poly-gamma-glutamate biosynthesis protein [Arthrospira platensis C1]